MVRTTVIVMKVTKVTASFQLKVLDASMLTNAQTTSVIQMPRVPIPRGHFFVIATKDIVSVLDSSSFCFFLIQVLMRDFLMKR